MTLCVYAVVPGGGGRVSTRGLGGEALRPIVVGRQAAIAGSLPRVPGPSAKALAHYDQILRALTSRFSSVLPARFGTCFRNVDELRLALASRERLLSRDLKRVRGRAQMTIRIFSGSGRSGSRLQASDSGKNSEQPGARSPQPTASDPGAWSPEPGASGAAYLRARAADASRAQHIPGFDPVRDAVRRWVREEQVEKRDEVASVYHLVPRASVGAYRRAIERAAAGSRLRMIVSGPHPPYAFT